MAYTTVPREETEMTSPRPPFLADGPPLASRESFLPSTNDSRAGLAAATKMEPYGGYGQHYNNYNQKPPRPRRRRSPVIWLIGILAILLIATAVIVPVYFLVIKKNNEQASGRDNTPTNNGTATPGTNGPTGNEITGGDGSTIRAADGSTFTYNNKFGGIWYSDPEKPYSDNAYANEWTPPLNQTWDFNTNKILGTNLGGWFVLEPFISPALFQKYPGAVDEWTLSEAMAADTAGGGLNQLEDHYKTFITEQDIADIAGAGLNWVRLPVPFWAIDKIPEEPFLEKTSWKYIVQALHWCKKYGLRVKLDLHTIPGSQNGYNHSGKLGTANFMMGTMGAANAQRALNYIRIFTEFISQPEWKNVVVMFGIMNEPRIEFLGGSAVRSFHAEAYRMVRGITGIGEGKGPYISIHHGFTILKDWEGYLAGADRLVMDDHPYMAFDEGVSPDPIDVGTGPDAGGLWPGKACTRWSANMNQSRIAFGITIAGEYSNAINDCGLFIRGVNGPPMFGDCTAWNDYATWTEGTKAGLKRFALASMDALKDWFFWTWKIGPAISGKVEAPFWSYSLGLKEGWMPTDPREAYGACPAIGPVFDRFQPWMVGGEGAGVITDPTPYPFPPETINNASAPFAQLPVYTLTGTINTLPVPAPTGGATASGTGWTNANDNWGAPVPIEGCVYPPSWDSNNVTVVPEGCTAPNAFPPQITPSA